MDKLVTLGLAEKLKYSDFTLESKMEELNQNKNSEQPDGPDVVWKLTMGINQYHVQRNCLHVLYAIVFLEVQ